MRTMGSGETGRTRWMGLLVAFGMVGSALAQGEGRPPSSTGGSESLSGWKYAIPAPDKLGGKGSTNTTEKTADLLVWVPPGAKRIRSVFLVPNNSDSKDFSMCEPLRKAAVKAEMGIVYIRKNFDTGIEWERKSPPDRTLLPGLLNHVAESTGIAEFRYAPWITFGKSSRGSFPYRAAWLWPERTIASVTYHGETPTWPVPDWAPLKGQTILQVNANGESEWGGTWFRHVRPSLLNYRARTGWLSHQVVSWGVGHGDYLDETSGKNNQTDRIERGPIWSYLAMFIGKANELRVPTDPYPTNGPVVLKQVDEAGGYLIDPFAVEDLFFKPHHPLTSSPDGYLVGDAGESPVTGFAAILPAAESIRVAGVPVTELTAGRSPSAWLVTEGMKFAMKKDPMTDLAGLEKLRPKPGDKVVIDAYEATFHPIAPRLVAGKGGIAVGALQKKGQNLTVLAYTVLEVAGVKRMKLKAPFSVAGRLQVVVNGEPVEHRQVVEFQKGLYPMLVALSLNGVSWGSIEPLFEETTEEEEKLARQAVVEKARRLVEQEKLCAAGPKPATALIRKAADVPVEDRKKMFWVADREQAEAWFNLHARKGQKFNLP